MILKSHFFYGFFIFWGKSISSLLNEKNRNQFHEPTTEVWPLQALKHSRLFPPLQMWNIHIFRLDYVNKLSHSSMRFLWFYHHKTFPISELIFEVNQKPLCDSKCAANCLTISKNSRKLRELYDFSWYLFIFRIFSSEKVIKRNTMQKQICKLNVFFRKIIFIQISVKNRFWKTKTSHKSIPLCHTEVNKGLF